MFNSIFKNEFDDKYDAKAIKLKKNLNLGCCRDWYLCVWLYQNQTHV